MEICDINPSETALRWFRRSQKDLKTAKSPGEFIVSRQKTLNAASVSLSASTNQPARQQPTRRKDCKRNTKPSSFHEMSNPAQRWEVSKRATFGSEKRQQPRKALCALTSQLQLLITGRYKHRQVFIEHLQHRWSLYVLVFRIKCGCRHLSF